MPPTDTAAVTPPSRSVTVEVTISQWAWSDVDPPLVLTGGEHLLDDPSPALLCALAAAEAADAGVRVVSADRAHLAVLRAAVEVDKVSLAFKAKCLKVRHQLLAKRDAAISAGIAVEEAIERHEHEVDVAIRRLFGGKA